MKKHLNFDCIFLVLLIIFISGCSKDEGVELDENGEIIPEQGSQIVSGDPSLNSFLITKNDESIITVDPETGQEEVIYTFDDLIDPEGIPDYENGTVFWTTDDNAMNAVSVAGSNFLWDTPLLEYKFSSLDVSSMVCLDGVCYATGGSGVVVAADQNTGDIKW